MTRSEAIAFARELAERTGAEQLVYPRSSTAFGWSVCAAQDANDHDVDLETDCTHRIPRAGVYVVRAPCLGHESTDGPIGNVVFCDASCRNGGGS